MSETAWHEADERAGRRYGTLDRLILGLDHALRTLWGEPHATGRPYPGEALDEAPISEAERRHVAGLMRVDHAGEVSAQALYQGQAVTARRPEVRRAMERAALEENDHLVWCRRRLEELGSRTSLLDPFWYAGSFAIGALAGAAGDRWSLGFVVETERQVVQHLDDHLRRLPPQDARSRAILEQMKEDEGHHATTALRAGAAELPGPVKGLMRLTSKVMTTTAYWI
ncbi:MAG: 2-polyprenyl-3-methyl-6-methoxy-1,4-benzoquinone monooxygenase [Gammaproteobacteria bacterium]|nr:MAG: 2-polyprenyl-3-methyl-6-methoxy-1,4-benzoquinone monooxygenase [Gammaproteobacteria bacterium]